MAKYQQYWGQVSPMIAEKLTDFTKQWGCDAVCTAIEIAKENGASNINYIRAVLENSNVVLCQDLVQIKMMVFMP